MTDTENQLQVKIATYLDERSRATNMTLWRKTKQRLFDQYYKLRAIAVQTGGPLPDFPALPLLCADGSIKMPPAATTTTTKEKTPMPTTTKPRPGAAAAAAAPELDNDPDAPSAVHAVETLMTALRRVSGGDEEQALALAEPFLSQSLESPQAIQDLQKAADAIAAEADARWGAGKAAPPRAPGAAGSRGSGGTGEDPTGESGWDSLTSEQQATAVALGMDTEAKRRQFAAQYRARTRAAATPSLVGFKPGANFDAKGGSLWDQLTPEAQKLATKMVGTDPAKREAFAEQLKKEGQAKAKAAATTPSPDPFTGPDRTDSPGKLWSKLTEAEKSVANNMGIGLSNGRVAGETGKESRENYAREVLRRRGAL